MTFKIVKSKLDTDIVRFMRGVFGKIGKTKHIMRPKGANRYDYRESTNKQ